MSEQTLMALMNLMVGLIGDGAVSAENKKIADGILTKCLAIAEKNITTVHANVVGGIKLTA
jgi:hypothetical protein